MPNNWGGKRDGKVGRPAGKPLSAAEIEQRRQPRGPGAGRPRSNNPSPAALAKRAQRHKKK